MPSMLRGVTWVIVIAFFINNLTPGVYASSLSLPLPHQLLASGPKVLPPMIRGMVINQADPLKFNFLLEQGTAQISQEELQKEAETSIKYFLASLAVPDEDQWVNLSPQEKDRIIPDAFGRTEMGRDLLAEDYVLKQLASSMLFPENGLGKAFWDKVYALAAEKYHGQDININNFNRVWIAPAEAQVWEHDGKVVILKSRLKVMLESDYLAKAQDPADEGVNNIMRDILIPALEKEVNEGEHFARLRQIYSAMILAAWYKETLKGSFLGQTYSDKNKVAGIGFHDQQDKERIYNQYLEAVRGGVYNFIKEETTTSGDLVPRKYFSGGFKKGNFFRALVLAGVFVVAGPFSSLSDQDKRVATGLYDKDNKVYTVQGEWGAINVAGVSKDIVLFNSYQDDLTAQLINKMIINARKRIPFKREDLTADRVARILRRAHTENVEEKDKALIALGIMRLEGTVPYLLEELHKATAFNRLARIEALKYAGDPSAAPELFKYFDDHPAGVTAALMRLDPDKYIPLLIKPLLELEMMGFSAIIKEVPLPHDPRLIPVWKKALYAMDEGVGAEGLAKYLPEVAPLFIEFALKSKWANWKGVYFLVENEKKLSTEVLLKAYHEIPLSVDMVSMTKLKEILLKERGINYWEILKPKDKVYSVLTVLIFLSLFSGKPIKKLQDYLEERKKKERRLRIDGLMRQKNFQTLLRYLDYRDKESEVYHYFLAHKAEAQQLLIDNFLQRRGDVRDLVSILDQYGWAPEKLEDKVEFYYNLGREQELVKDGLPAFKLLAQRVQVGLMSEFYGGIETDWEYRMRNIGEAATPVLVDFWRSQTDLSYLALLSLKRLGWEPKAPEERARFYSELKQWNDMVCLGAIAAPFLWAAGKNDLLFAVGPSVKDFLFGMLKSSDMSDQKRAALLLRRLGWQPENSEQRLILEDLVFQRIPLLVQRMQEAEGQEKYEEFNKISNELYVMGAEEGEIVYDHSIREEVIPQEDWYYEVIQHDVWTKTVRSKALNPIRVPDAAQINAQNKQLGGIDMNRNRLNLLIKRDGTGVPLPASQQNWSQVDIQGLKPVIYKMEPANMRVILGMSAGAGMEPPAGNGVDNFVSPVKEPEAV